MYHHQKLGRFLWKNGRAWIGKWNWEWILLRARCELSLAFGHYGESVGGHIEIPFLLTLHVHRSVMWTGQKENQFRIRLTPKEFHFKLWGPSNEWNSRDPWWKLGKTFDFLDILLGRYKYTKRIIETRDIVIPMPEGSYAATMKLEKCEWRRPRWPFPIRQDDAWVDIPGGIPVQGKGENSWDCGDDGIFGTGARSHDEAVVIGKIVTSVLKSRKDYGNTSKVRDAGIVYARDRIKQEVKDGTTP